MIHGMIADNRDNLPRYPPGNVKGARTLNPGVPLDPKEFAAVLICKLEEVKRHREMDEKLNQRMSEFEDSVGVPHQHCAGGGNGGEEITPNVLAAAINRLQVQDEGLPDDILG